ncbi:MAG: 16S rRNA (uracil(1498)-N(3))-methyltransferase [Polyangiaceae bacterium]|nr:16S rRNA (uracil(1498)-N(3))-methyltransferase [Polyangiaceae bacterium]
MRRPIRVPVEGLLEGPWELPPAAGHYVARVLRKARGDTLLLFDPRLGVEALARIEAVDGASVRVLVQGPAPASVPERDVVLVQALGKGDKMDAVVQDATELGVARIVPVLSERTVVQPGPKAAARVERWRRIAAEASRQSGRAQAPEIDPIRPLLEAVEGIPSDLRLALVPGAAQPAGPLLLGPTAALAFLVGPEGGLSERECQELEQRGWVLSDLGPWTLRTETVATAVLGALLVSQGAGSSPRSER